MKNIALLITSIISGFSVLFIVVSYLEKPTSEFTNYEEMAASGLIKSGWVPKYIPKSATNIKEQHDLDTNQVNIYFNYVPNQKEDLLMECNKIISNGIGQKYICPPFEGQTSILVLRADGVGIYESYSDGLY